jgi:hypothetical protein
VRLGGGMGGIGRLREVVIEDDWVV